MRRTRKPEDRDSAESDPYEQLARYYDYGHDGFVDDIDLYDALARRSDAPVLELGVGTGRVAIALTERGHTVVGIDRSEAMLAVARGKAAALDTGALQLSLDDMRSPMVAGPFGLIICAIDTFLHLHTTDDQLQTLAAARDRLAADGVLVLDLPGPGGDWGDWQTGARPLVLDWSTVDCGRRISRFTTFRADPAAQLRHVTEVFEEIDAGGAVRKHVIEYALRLVFPAEAELLLRLAGLRLHTRYGNYDLGPFDGDSPRMVLVAAAG